MFVLASHIRILGYLLGRLFSKASLLVLLFLFLRVLLLYFLPLLGLFRALKCLPPMALTMLRLGFLLPQNNNLWEQYKEDFTDFIKAIFKTSSIISIYNL